MSPATALAVLLDRGVQVTARAGELQLRGRRSVVTAEAVDLARQHRTALLALLTEPDRCARCGLPGSVILILDGEQVCSACWLGRPRPDESRRGTIRLVPAPAAPVSLPTPIARTPLQESKPGADLERCSRCQKVMPALTTLVLDGQRRCFKCWRGTSVTARLNVTPPDEVRDVQGWISRVGARRGSVLVATRRGGDAGWWVWPEQIKTINNQESAAAIAAAQQSDVGQEPDGKETST